MTILKSFCFCFTPKTGSVVLGCLGIIFAVLMIVPPCLILDNHDFYFSEYIRQQKSYGGKRILKTLYKGNFEYNAEVIYSLFIQWRSLDKKGIDYLSNSLWTIIITLWGSIMTEYLWNHMNCELKSIKNLKDWENAQESMKCKFQANESSKRGKNLPFNVSYANSIWYTNRWRKMRFD